jgi:hypothetical protein
MPKFRKTITEWMSRRFGVELDPEDEVFNIDRFLKKELPIYACPT